MAKMAHFYFTRDAAYEVVAFTVSRDYLREGGETFCGLPIVDFEEISMLYPPEVYGMFVAIGYKNLNKDREKFYNLSKKKGYALVTYISPNATVMTSDIGDNCFIFEHNTIQPFVKIGHNVILWSGNHVGHDATIADHCFITSQVVLAGRTHVGAYSFVGINATIIDGIKVLDNCIIGAGALITSDTKPGAVYKAKSAELCAVPSCKVRI